MDRLIALAFAYSSATLEHYAHESIIYMGTWLMVR